MACLVNAYLVSVHGTVSENVTSVNTKKRLCLVHCENLISRQSLYFELKVRKCAIKDDSRKSFSLRFPYIKMYCKIGVVGVPVQQNILSFPNIFNVFQPYLNWFFSNLRNLRKKFDKPTKNQLIFPMHSTKIGKLRNKRRLKQGARLFSLNVYCEFIKLKSVTCCLLHENGEAINHPS